MARRPRAYQWLMSCVAVLPTTGGGALAVEDRVVLKDGMILSGELEHKENQVIVRQRQRIYQISQGSLLKPEAGAARPPTISFQVPQPVPPRIPKPIAPLAGFSKVGRFDEYGRRSATVMDLGNRGTTVVQVIHAVFPTHVETDIVDGSFKSTAPLGALPPVILRKLLRRCIDVKSGPDRIKVVEFLLQAERFSEAEAELAEAKKEFPDLASRLDDLAGRLRARSFELVFQRLEQWIAAGQFLRAQELAPEVRKLAPPDALPRIDAIIAELKGMTANLQSQIGLLRAANESLSPKPERIRDLNAALGEIQGRLSPANSARLQPMETLAKQRNSKPDQTLALAVSGWVLGADLAHTDLEKALDQWLQRETLRQSLEGDEVQFQERLRTLLLPSATGKPAPGVDVLVKMIPLLPAPRAEIAINASVPIKAASAKFTNLEYQLYLPPEYDPFRRYPTVVALSETNDAPAHQLELWRGVAADAGWIVVAPRWKLEEASSWDFTVEEHVHFQEILDDVRRRFAVDADRVLLTGHGTGGIAAWDLGMSHPDQFAGLAPFNAVPTLYCEKYVANLAHLPVFVVMGGLNIVQTTAMQTEFSKYVGKNYDALYVSYPARGAEGFGSELPTVFDWMKRKRRNILPREINAAAARQSERRFYWLQADSIRAAAIVPPQLFRRRVVRPATMNGTVNDSNGILVRAGNIEELTVVLSPGLIQLDAPGLSIKVNNKIAHRGPIQPDLETLLRELRRSGDYQRLVLAKVKVRL